LLSAHGAVSLYFNIVEVSRWLFRTLEAYAERLSKRGKATGFRLRVSAAGAVRASWIVATGGRKQAILNAQVFRKSSVFFPLLRPFSRATDGSNVEIAETF
jgi:hypothetical protein